MLEYTGAIAIARRSREKGNHPFGALFVDAAGEVVAEAENTVTSDHDPTAHAEINLVRAAVRRFDPDYLAGCTLYSSTEPCTMCAGATYWAELGRVVYALGEDELRRMTGITQPTRRSHCRFAKCSRGVSASCQCRVRR